MTSSETSTDDHGFSEPQPKFFGFFSHQQRAVAGEFWYMKANKTKKRGSKKRKKRNRRKGRRERRGRKGRRAKRRKRGKFGRKGGKRNMVVVTEVSHDRNFLTSCPWPDMVFKGEVGKCVSSPHRGLAQRL